MSLFFADMIFKIWMRTLFRVIIELYALYWELFWFNVDKLADSLPTPPLVPSIILLPLLQLKQLCPQPSWLSCARKLKPSLNKIPPELVLCDWARLTLVIYFMQCFLSSKFEKRAYRLESLLSSLAFWLNMVSYVSNKQPKLFINLIVTIFSIVISNFLIFSRILTIFTLRLLISLFEE